MVQLPYPVNPANRVRDKIDRLLALQDKVQRNSQAIVRLKTVWSFVAAGIALVVAALKDWLFGQK